MHAHTPPEQTAETTSSKTNPPALALRSPLKQKILTAAERAEKHAANVKKESSKAIGAAYECGRLLRAEKEWLEIKRDEAREQVKLLRENGQTLDATLTFWRDADWQTYFDANYSKAITRERAARFARLAAEHDHQTTFAFDDSPNVIRSGLLALDLFPKKHHDAIPGDVPLEKAAGHLVVINRFALWLHGYRRKHGAKLSVNERGRLLADFSIVAQFIDRLRKPDAEI